MIKTVKIYGDDSLILSVALNDVLACLNDGKNINWGLSWIHAVGELADNESMLDLEERINETEYVSVLSWAELLKLSTQIVQAIELLIIGNKQSLSIKKYSNDIDMYKSCDYTIELIDSSFWIIHSTDHIFLENILKRLQGVECCEI